MTKFLDEIGAQRLVNGLREGIDVVIPTYNEKLLTNATQFGNITWNYMRTEETSVLKAAKYKHCGVNVSMKSSDGKSNIKLGFGEIYNNNTYMMLKLYHINHSTQTAFMNDITKLSTVYVIAYGITTFKTFVKTGL